MEFFRTLKKIKRAARFLKNVPQHLYWAFVRFLVEASLNDGEVIIEARRSAHVPNVI